MKAAQREIYVVLANEVDFSVCSFCKFAEGSGCGQAECHHGLRDRYGFPDCYGELYPGDDCWGFRPMRDVATVADIVGIMLANGWIVAGWETNPEGRLLVYGSKDWA